MSHGPEGHPVCLTPSPSTVNPLCSHANEVDENSQLAYYTLLHLIPSSMSVDGPVASYVNPGGHVHDTLTAKEAENVRTHGPSSTDHSWFPGWGGGRDFHLYLPLYLSSFSLSLIHFLSLSLSAGSSSGSSSPFTASFSDSSSSLSSLSLSAASSGSSSLSPTSLSHPAWKDILTIHSTVTPGPVYPARVARGTWDGYFRPQREVSILQNSLVSVVRTWNTNPVGVAGTKVNQKESEVNLVPHLEVEFLFVFL